MQVRPADGRRRDLDDRVAGVYDLGVGQGFRPNIVFALPCQGTHRFFLLVLAVAMGITG
jgi:hypothetical protein